MSEQNKPWEQNWNQPSAAVPSTQSNKKPWEQSWNGSPEPEVEKSKGFGGHVRDIGASLAAGAAALPDVAIGVGDILTGGAVGKAVEDSGLYTPGSGAKYWQDKKTDIAKEQSQQFSDAEGIWDKAKVALSNPTLITNTVAESLPTMVAGGLVGRGLSAATKGAISPMVGGAIGEGTMMAGGQAEQIRQQTDDGLLNNNQVAASVATGALGTLFGLAGGAVAKKFGFGDVDSMLAGANANQIAGEISKIPLKSVPKHVLAGALSEGLLEELPQSVQEQVLQNHALNKDLMDGVDDAIVMGTLAGMTMGGTASGLNVRGHNQRYNAQEQFKATQQQEQAAAEQQAPPNVDLGLDTTVTPQPMENTAQANVATDLSGLADDRVTEPAAEPQVMLPSEKMGIDPNAGPLSAAAATAVDNGVSQQMQIQAQLEQAAAIADKDGQKAGKEGLDLKSDPSITTDTSTAFSAAENDLVDFGVQGEPVTSSQEFTQAKQEGFAPLDDLGAEFGEIDPNIRDWMRAKPEQRIEWAQQAELNPIQQRHVVNTPWHQLSKELQGRLQTVMPQPEQSAQLDSAVEQAVSDVTPQTRMSAEPSQAVENEADETPKAALSDFKSKIQQAHLNNPADKPKMIDAEIQSGRSRAEVFAEAKQAIDELSQKGTQDGQTSNTGSTAVEAVQRGTAQANDGSQPNTEQSISTNDNGTGATAQQSAQDNAGTAQAGTEVLSSPETASAVQIDQEIAQVEQQFQTEKSVPKKAQLRKKLEGLKAKRAEIVAQSQQAKTAIPDDVPNPYNENQLRAQVRYLGVQASQEARHANEKDSNLITDLGEGASARFNQKIQQQFPELHKRAEQLAKTAEMTPAGRRGNTRFTSLSFKGDPSYESGDPYPKKLSKDEILQQAIWHLSQNDDNGKSPTDGAITNERINQTKGANTETSKRATQVKSVPEKLKHKKAEAASAKEQSSFTQIQSEYGSTHSIPSHLLDKALPLSEIVNDLVKMTTDGINTDVVYGQKLIKQIAKLNPDVKVHIVTDLDSIQDSFIRANLLEGGFYVPDQNTSYIYPKTDSWESSVLELVNHELVHTVTEEFISQGSLSAVNNEQLQEIKDFLGTYIPQNYENLSENVKHRLMYAYDTNFPHELFSVGIAESEVRQVLSAALGEKFKQVDAIFDVISIQHGDVNVQLKQNSNTSNSERKSTQGISSLTETDTGTDTNNSPRAGTSNKSGRRAGTVEKDTASNKQQDELNRKEITQEIDETTDSDKRLFSRINDTKRPGQTPEQVREVLVKRFGEKTISSLERRGLLDIVSTINEPGVEGFYQNGRVTLVADNLTETSIIPTFLHELGGHGGFQNFMNKEQYAELMRMFNDMVERKHPIALEAKRLAEREQDNETQQLEYLPYLLTLASTRQEMNALQKSALRRFVDKVISAVKAWLFDRLGINLNLNEDDMLVLANRVIQQQINAPTSEDIVRAKYRGSKEWMKAPNGKPTNLTEQQWLQVRTPEFKAWFGDWENNPETASKIVDENGEPKVVYHGTSAKFTRFNLGGGLLGRGVYLTDQFQEAENYAGSRSNGVEGTVLPLFANIRDVFETTAKTTRDQILTAAQKGFNGIRHQFDDMSYMVAFKPEQVKLAVGNTGLFNSRDADIRYSYAGNKAAQADKKSLKRAQQMKAQGQSSQQILYETGWFEGLDGEWRFEINDSDSAIISKGQKQLNKDGEVPLTGLLNHPKLFENYPQLADVTVRLHPADSGYRGGWIADDNEIGINESVIQDDPDYLHSLLMHELQHAIQTEEGFAEGGAPDYRDQAIDEYQWLKQDKQSKNRYRQRKAAEAMAEQKLIEQQLQQLPAGKEGDAQRQKLNARMQKLQDQVQKAEISKQEYDAIAEKLENVKFSTPHEFYMSIAGEIEARDVQARMDLNDQERRLTPPYSSQGDYVNDPVIIRDSQIAASGPDILYSRTANAQQIIQNLVGNMNKQGAAKLRDKAAFKLTDSLQYLLSGLGRRQLTDIYHKILPQMKRYNDTVAQMDADKNEVAARADDIVVKWAKLKDEAELASVMHEATLAQIDPAKPYQSGDSVAKYAQLKKAFDALTPEAQAMYKEARNAYSRHHREVREAIKERILRSSLSSQKKTELLQQMDAHFFGYSKGVYFPLQRFGKYVVLVRDAKGTVLSVSRAETMNEANELRKVLMDEYPNDVVNKPLLDKDFQASRDMVGRGFMTNLFNELGSFGLNAQRQAEMEDILGQLYLKSLPDLSYAKHSIHRKGTAGFSQDARRAFAQNMTHGASYLAKLRYKDQLETMLDDMQKHADDQAKINPDYDQPVAQRVINEMVKRHESLMSPDSHPLSTALTSLGFLYYLGLSPASATVNTLQTALVAYPQMGAKWGFDKAYTALKNAGIDFAKGFSAQSMDPRTWEQDIAKVLKGDELKAYKEAVRRGTIDVTMAHDLAGVAQGEDSGVMRKIAPLMKGASWMFHKAERFNREVTFIAGYRLARDAGASHDDALEQAIKATYDGHFDYSSSNRPRIMQGNIAKVVLLFKQFGQNMLYTLIRTTQQAFMAETPAARTEARKALAGILATHFLAAGALGLPLIGPLLTMASWMGGDEDEPWDAEVALRNALADAVGNKTAEVLMKGVSRLGPADLSGRVGINNLLVPDTQDGLEGKELSEATVAAFLGPVVGIMTNVFKGMNEIGEGHGLRGVETMAPVFARSPLRAYRYAEEGNMDKTGVMINEDVGIFGVLSQAMGFSPSEVRLASEGRSAIFNHTRRLDARRSELMSEFARAMKNGDKEEQDAVWSEIQAFNEKNPSRRINRIQAMQSLRQREKRVREAENGVYLPRKKRDDADVARFAFDE